MSNSILIPDTLSLYQSTDTTQRIVLLLEYQGSGFCGSQYQPQQVTIQSELQKALEKLHIPASAVSFAGRTDSGVSAKGHVAHFDTPVTALNSIPNLPKALNAVLPATISIRDFAVTGRQFNSRKDSSVKWYRYTVYNAPTRSVWAALLPSLHFSNTLSVELMNEAAQQLLGSSDFSSFKDSGSVTDNKVCNIQYIAVRQDGYFLNFDVAADRFLYKMVRNIMGQLLEIGQPRKKLSPQYILDVLKAKDRRQSAATAPPDGLTLMAIHYKPPFNFFTQDALVQELDKMINPMNLEFQSHENLFRKAS